MAKKRLGRGFATLISNPEKSNLASGKTITQMEVSSISPNPHQPRKSFNDEALKELAASIKQFGVAQPLLVRKSKKGYELIAGERRLRAAKKAGFKQVPVIIREISNEESVELAIVENIQREDLSALDEAEAYEDLKKEFNLTQDQIAEKVSKSRSAVANILRLNDLPTYIKNAIRKDELTAGHARALVSISDPAKQKEIFQKLISQDLNVREAEKLLQELKAPKIAKKYKSKATTPVFELSEVSSQISSLLGTKVSLHGTEEKGYINIHYFSKEDLERIVEIILKK